MPISPPLEPSPSPEPPLEDIAGMEPVDELASLEDMRLHISEEEEAALERVAIDQSEEPRQMTEEEIEAFLNGGEDGNLVCYSLQDFLVGSVNDADQSTQEPDGNQDQHE